MKVKVHSFVVSVMAIRLLAGRAATALRVNCAPPAGLVKQSVVPFWRQFSAEPAGGQLVEPGLIYDKTHEWLKVEGDVATVGITDFAQDNLGEIVFVELPDVGKSFAKGEAFATVESVKAVGEVYAPVTGEVVEVNPTVLETTGLLNTSPYDQGWLAKVKLADKGELKDMLSADAYSEFLTSTGH